MRLPEGHDRGGDGIDLRAPTSRDRPYVIGTAGRAASTLLAEAIRSCGSLGLPEEYLHSINVPGWARTWGVPSPNDGRHGGLYLAAMRRHAATADGPWALKLHTGSIDVARYFTGLRRRRPLSDVLLALGVTRVVHVTRHDKVAAAFSFWRAAHTGEYQRYAHTEPRAVSGSPDPDVIEEIHASLHRSDDLWRRLDRRRFEVFELSHREIVLDVFGVVSRIAAWLEIEPPTTLSHMGLPRKIRDDRVDEMVRAWRLRHAPCDRCAIEAAGLTDERAHGSGARRPVPALPPPT